MATAIATPPRRRTLVLAVLMALSAITTVGTFAAGYFPATNQYSSAVFQTNALTGDPTGLTATPVANSNVVNLHWTDAASTNFGNGDVQLVEASTASHACPTAATSYTFEVGSAYAASSAHNPADTVDPAGAAGKTPAGAWVCYAAAIAYGQGAATSWTSATPLWYGFAPTRTANAARHGEYVSSITLSNQGAIQSGDTIVVNYSQNTNKAAKLAGLVVCDHRDPASGMTIVFLGYSGATCNYTPATAATAKTQFGYVVQTSGTTDSFGADNTQTFSVAWNASGNRLTLTMTSDPNAWGPINETSATWAYHVSATAPAGATQVKNSAGGSLVAENAYCPVATSAVGW